MIRRHHPAFAPAVLLALGLLALVVPAVAQVPLDPTLLPKFDVPLPQPPILDGTATTAATPVEIRMSEFQQMILPPAFYPPAFSGGTYLWGYNGIYPGPTIAALRGTPTWVHYINDLKTSDGSPLFLQQRIKVDETIHWADPLGTGHSMDQYLGPAPACVHLHGGEVPSSYDGGPDAWWTPGFTHKGPGFVTDLYEYPNQQENTTLFYHDHVLGMTRTNLYSGLAGFYLLLDPAAEASLPGGSADHGTDQYGNPYQLGMAIQDRMFDTEGQLYWPAGSTNPEHSFWLPEFFGDVVLVNGRPWPYLNVEPRRYRLRIVNGSNARFYRMRLEDHDQNVMGPAIWQIGSDGGLLDQPVLLADPTAGGLPQLILAPGERGDLVIDFAGWEGRNLILTNDAPAPFPDGDAVDAQTGVIMQFRVGSTVTGGSDPTLDVATLPSLRAAPIERPAVPAITRALTLNEHAGSGGPLEMFVNNTMWDATETESPVVGSTEVWEIINLTGDTHPMHLHLFQYQMIDRQAFDGTAYELAYGAPTPGSGPPLPYGELSAATGFKLGGNPDVTPFLLGLPSPPDPNERGWKDTFRMNPGEVTHVLLRVAPQDADALAAAHVPPLTVGPGVNLYPFEPWTPLGQTDSFGQPGGPGYVWHCHIVDHEDNEMMRPLGVAGPGTPTAVVLARFDAVADGDGVRVTWELSGATAFASVALERGDAPGGPWSAVGARPAAVGRASVVLDRAVQAGRTYWYRLSAVTSDGAATTFGPIEGSLGSLLTFSLGAVSPNPSHGPLRVDFALAAATHLDLSVLDVQGRQVARLASGPHAAGRYQLLWDGTSGQGRVPAGLYFVRYRTPQKEMTQRVVIAR